MSKFLADLNFDYNLVKDQLDLWIRDYKKDHPYRRIAWHYRELVGSELGPVNLNENMNSKKRFIFIGGSGKEQSFNEDSFHDSLIDWHEFIFNGEVLTFFNGGPEHEKTHSLLKERTVFFDYHEATWEKIYTKVQEWAAEDAEEITIVLSAHGHTRFGIGLWSPDTILPFQSEDDDVNGDSEEGENREQRISNYTLMASDDIDTLSSFFPEKKFRIFVKSCNAQTVMLNPNRKIPSRMETFLKYLDQYYPANRCFFAESLSGEFSWGVRRNGNSSKKYLDTFMGELMLKHPRLTLEDYQQFNFAQTQIEVSDSWSSVPMHLSSTPNLSSDSLVWDLATLVCRDRRQVELYSYLPEEGRHYWQELYEEFCADNEYNIERRSLDERVRIAVQQRNPYEAGAVELARKEHIYSRLSSRKAMIEKLLDYSGMEKIRDRYFTLRACEQEPVN